MPNNKGFQFQS